MKNFLAVFNLDLINVLLELFDSALHQSRREVKHLKHEVADIFLIFYLFGKLFVQANANFAGHLAEYNDTARNSRKVPRVQ